jgi:hypothetical protein
MIAHDFSFYGVRINADCADTFLIRLIGLIKLIRYLPRQAIYLINESTSQYSQPTFANLWRSVKIRVLNISSGGSPNGY